VAGDQFVLVVSATVDGQQSNFTIKLTVPDLTGTTVGLTAGAIAAIWAALAATLSTVGSIGKLIVDTLTSLGVGIGPYVVTITVEDEDGNPVESALVRLSRTGQSRFDYSDGDGVVQLGCVAATWEVAIEAVGHTFTPVELVVADDVDQTYELTADEVPEPAGPGLATGRVRCYGTNGLPKANVPITLQLVTGDAVVGTSPSTLEFEIRSASDGWATFNGFMIGSSYDGWRADGTKVRFAVTAANFLMPQMLGEP